MSHVLVVNGSCHIRMSHGAYERVMPFLRVGHAHAFRHIKSIFPKFLGKANMAVMCLLRHVLQGVAVCCSVPVMQGVAVTRR